VCSWRRRWRAAAAVVVVPDRYSKLFDVVWVANLHVHHIAATPETAGIQVG
jgi:hypothetical protein